MNVCVCARCSFIWVRLKLGSFLVFFSFSSQQESNSYYTQCAPFTPQLISNIVLERVSENGFCPLKNATLQNARLERICIPTTTMHLHCALVFRETEQHQLIRSIHRQLLLHLFITCIIIKIYSASKQSIPLATAPVICWAHWLRIQSKLSKEVYGRPTHNGTPNSKMRQCKFHECPCCINIARFHWTKTAERTY